MGVSGLGREMFLQHAACSTQPGRCSFVLDSVPITILLVKIKQNLPHNLNVCEF